MMDHGAVRNLEQIQEFDPEARTPRWITGALLVVGGGCIAFAVMAMGNRKTSAMPVKLDPLADLVAQQQRPATTQASKPTDLRAQDVTFPGILSDDPKPTTALAAVKGQSGAAAAEPALPTPPPATDRLPVVPLPAQHVLEATPVVTRPRDPLTKAASEAVQPATPAPSAPSGREGGYQLQVSSFRNQAEANQFADQLRTRGHKAYVSEAHVSGRGTWYRVRVGPFATQHAAAAYRVSFESKEHVVPFIVPPKSGTP